jgi:hypothetical protein
MPDEERKAFSERARDHVEKYHHQDRYAQRLGQLYCEELAKVKK